MITLLDGGMGQELIRRTDRAPNALWATQVMLDHPELVREIHDDFFAAGADVATTNTYALHHDRLGPNGVDDQFQVLHELACRTAVAARDAHGAGLVAGAIGPLGASYRPDLAPDASRAAELYAEVCTVQAPFVDLYLCETVASIEQVRGALWGTVPMGKPVWLALTVEDTDGSRLRSGEPLADVLPVIAENRPAGVLLNCSTPEAIDQGLATLAQSGLPFGAYANGFTHIADAFKVQGQVVDDLQARQDLSPAKYAAFVDGWVTRGATIVGGCCEVGPAHIRRLADDLKGKD